MDKFKVVFVSVAGAVGGSIANYLGGWDAGLKTLVLFMALDYAMGLVVAGVFHRSPKTQTGALNSKIGWIGLARKGGTMAIVLVAAQLDTLIGTNIIRDGVVIAFITNEAISIAENAGLMGIKVPQIVVRAVDVLTQKNNETKL